MTNIKRYPLSFSKTYSYFIDVINGENALSKSVLKEIDFSSGQFFTFLPDTQEFKNHIYSFKCSYRNSSVSVSNYVYRFVYKAISCNSHLAVVFDDFLSKYNPDYKEELFLTNGKHYNDKIYYFFSKTNLSLNRIKTAFQYSNQIWHSMALIYDLKSSIIDGQRLSTKDCDEISRSTKAAIVTAYDAQGYVFWEKRSSRIWKH